MSDSDKKDKTDLTRIEDLSEFIHDDDDDLSDLDTFSDDDDQEDDIMDQSTDPDIEFPPEFNAKEDAKEETSNADTDDFENQSFDDSFSDDDDEKLESDDTFADTNSDSDDDFSDSSSDDDFSDSSSDDDFSESSSDDDFSESSSDDDFSESSSDDDFSKSSSDDDFSDSSSDDDFSDSSSDDDFSDSSSDDDFSESSSDGDFSESSSDDDFSESSSDDDFSESTTDDDFSESTTDDELPELPSSEKEDNLAPEPSPVEEIQNKKAETKTPIDQYQDKQEFKSPENFNELQKFAKNISYGNMGHEGNPPFSIIIKDIKFKEDIQDILNILKEYNVLDDDNINTAEDSLNRGSMLIPRLGEYSAIHLCHKLRKYDISLLMGLTEEIHPPKSYDSDDSGIISKYTVYNTKSHHYINDSDEIKLEDILTSTTPHLDGYHIREYITIGSEHIIIDAQSLTKSNNLEGDLKSAIPEYQKHRIDKTEIRSANLQASKSEPIQDFFPANAEALDNESNVMNLNDIYSSLLEKLKLIALKKKGNAIVGIHYNVTPIVRDESYYTETHYQVTCSGSIVWINRA